MITAFDRLVIAVPDLRSAVAQYQVLLGQAGQNNVFRLRNLDIQLQASASAGPPAIANLALLDDRLARNTQETLDSGARGIPLTRSHYREPRLSDTSGNSSSGGATGIYAVDHLVLQSRDADDCIRLFGEDLGMRLALDQDVPEWGGRMLFFRMGKMTLEIIHNRQQPPERDFFWGITYLCRDIDQTLESLGDCGVAHSPARKGRKPSTRVATLKSHALGLPTLLIGPA